MKTAIGASLPIDIYLEFQTRVEGFPGGKTGLIKDALRSYFEANPLTPAQVELLEKMKSEAGEAQ